MLFAELATFVHGAVDGVGKMRVRCLPLLTKEMVSLVLVSMEVGVKAKCGCQVMGYTRTTLD